MAEAGIKDSVDQNWSTSVVLFSGESPSRIPKREHLSQEPMNCPHEAASQQEMEYILEVAQQSHILILDFMALKLRVWVVSVAHLHL